MDDHSEAYQKYLQSLPQAFLLQVLENCFSEIFVADEKGKLIYVNPACLRHYGLSSEEMVGKNTEELSQKYGLWEPYSYKSVVEKGQTLITENLYHYINQNLLSISVPVFDEHGKFKLMVANVLDHFNRYDITYRNKGSIVTPKTREDETILGKSEKFKYCYKIIETTAGTDANILLLGESGTGKSVLATAAHWMSKRNEKEIISINCGAIPENLLESELFGYAPNAFTGANPKGKIGLIERANGGTLFLDEIGELPIGMQVKILDVLENKRFIPVGSNEVRSVDVRIISATNQNLLKLVREKKFRVDLYYRINTIKVTVPALRDRQEDILLLANHFLKIYNDKYDKKLIFSDKVLQQISIYTWPGNIRQLKNCIERLVILSARTVIEKKEFFDYLQDEEEYNSVESGGSFSYDDVIMAAEKELILRTFSQYKTSRKIAEVIGVSQTKANNLIRKYINGKDKG